MSHESRPQNACSPSPPRRPNGPSWLIAMAGKGPPEFAWILLGGPVSSDSPVHRSLKKHFASVVRQFVYLNGKAVILAKGSPQELSSIARAHSVGGFHPGLVEGVWLGMLPIPPEILANDPLGGDRHIQIIGLDPDASPKDELLRQVSHDFRINLVMLRREMVAQGVFFLLAGKGRPEAVESIVVLNENRLLPSPARANVILSVVSDAVGNPPGSRHHPDVLILDFKNSSPDQLSNFYKEVVGVLPADHAIDGNDLPPQPGSHVNARVEIFMPPRPQAIRDRLEQHARNVGGELNMKASISWLVGGEIFLRPDLG